MEQTEQTPTPRPSPLRHDAEARLPAAAFLRYESRADGWSAGRQAAFLAHLADHGVVADAARSVGMSQSGGYALRREARGYAFNLGWEAALLIARRIVSDRLMTAAIKGEESRWVREDGVTTYIRQNTKLSLALLDRVNPATSLAEVLAVATRFDWFLKLVDDGVAAERLWELFFEHALPHSEIAARARVRAALLLCDDTAGFENDGDGALDDANRDNDGNAAAPTEYKSMEGPPGCDDGRRLLPVLSKTDFGAAVDNAWPPTSCRTATGYRTATGTNPDKAFTYRGNRPKEPAMADLYLKALESERRSLWASARLKGLPKDSPERLRIATIDADIAAHKAKAKSPQK